MKRHNIRSYKHAIDFLYGRINYEWFQSENYSVRDFKLDRMRQLLSRLGNPQDRIPVVHVAGTKGKGSTAAIVSEILFAADYRVGLFTSPHLSAFEERMTVDGCRPSESTLIDLVNAVLVPVESMDATGDGMSPTFFEIATAMAWLYFTQQSVEIAVLEVGLGGRLDSTNICRPEVCIITNISHDHTALLGDSLSEIAYEKAGIIKHGVPVVSGVTSDEAGCVIEEMCHRRRADLIRLGRSLHYVRRRVPVREPRFVVTDELFNYSVDIETQGRSFQNLHLSLPGEHQAANASLAAGAVEILEGRRWSIPHEAVCQGIQSVKWPIRMEVLEESPTVIADAAHNVASAAALLQTVTAIQSVRRRILVFATSRDKDTAGMLQLLAPHFDTVILTQYCNNPRALPVRQIESMVKTASDDRYLVASQLSTAWTLAREQAGPEDLICITGSFFIAAEMRELILNEQGRNSHQMEIRATFPLTSD